MILCMRLFSVILFLTLVGSSAVAAPSANAPKPGLPSETPVPVEKAPLEKTETTQWTPSPNPPPPPETVVSVGSEFHRRSAWSVSPHGGLIAGQILEPADTETTTFAGAALSWEREAAELWDFSLDASATNWIRLGAARRFAIESVTLTFGPYWSVGVTQTLQGSDMLASIVDLKRVKAMANFGWDDLFEQDHQWTAEVGVGYGIAGAIFNAQAGWVYRW